MASNYLMRGARVSTLRPNEIHKFCEQVPKILGLNKSSLRQMDKFIESLCQRGVNIEIVADNDWFEIANAWCIPDKATIAMPERLYHRIVSRDTNALYVFFHELGHFMLAHRPLLHHSDIPPCQYEDSEWQADYFADTLLDLLGVKNHRQLPLFLE